MPPTSVEAVSTYLVQDCSTATAAKRRGGVGLLGPQAGASGGLSPSQACAGWSSGGSVPVVGDPNGAAPETGNPAARATRADVRLSSSWR